MEGVSIPSMYYVFASVVLSYLVYKAYFSKRRKYKLPPGPINLPLVGSIPFIEQQAEKTFAKWSKTYGPVFYMKLGSYPTVVLNSLESVEQAFVKCGHVFNGRYETFFTNFASCGGCGIIFKDNYEDWKTQRRFGSRALSGMCLQGKNLETRIMEEADLLCEVIRSHDEKPFVLEKPLTESISNVINGITMNRRCNDPGNEWLREYLERVIQGFRKDGFLYSLLAALPIIRFIPPIRGQYHQMAGRVENENGLFDSFIDEHVKTMDEKHPAGFIDMFVQEQRRKTKSFHKTQLRIYIKDLLSAGTETSASTLRWTLLYLVKHQDVQKKIHEEIDRVIGLEGQPKWDSDLPYTKAVVQEMSRYETAVPLSVPRRTYQDVKLFGYDIPENTQVIANLWQVHNDPKIWPNPREFIPERHLDEDGKFVKSDKIIPFSIGARNCLGENLARMEVFLFFVRIVQKFHLLPNKDEPCPELLAVPGPVHSPLPYPLIMKER